MEEKEQKNKLCVLRDIYRVIRDFELKFQEKHDLCLNEGMAICSLKRGRITSSELADKLGLSTSNTSKVIKSIEQKELIIRRMGKEDKRQMYFELSKKGKEKLGEMKDEEPAIFETLKEIYKTEMTIVSGTV